MTKAEAVKQIKTILGTLEGARYRGTRQATSPARRKRARQRLQILEAQRRDLGRELPALRVEMHAYRHRIAKQEGIFLTTIALGDTWEEVLEQLKAYVEKGRPSAGAVLAESAQTDDREADHGGVA